MLRSTSIFLIICAAALLLSSSATAQVVVVVNGPSTSINEGSTVTLTAVVSGLPSSDTTLTYTWTFDDTTYTGKVNVSSVTHTFYKPGLFNVVVKVENTIKGPSATPILATGSRPIRVLNLAPVISGIITNVRSGADLVPYTQMVAVGTSFQFQVMASDTFGTALSYTWMFGDCTKGSSGSSEVFHQFHFPGVFTVTVHVRDNYGGFSSSSRQVTIDCSPQLTNGTITDYVFLNNGNCHLYGKCTKMGPGNYTCNCEDGFMGDGFECVRALNPCAPDGVGYSACGSQQCIPEVVTAQANMYTGRFTCGSGCRPGFYRAGNVCVPRPNPCEDPSSPERFNCHTQTGSFENCIPEIVSIGESAHEALYTGNAHCGATCRSGFISVTKVGDFNVVYKFCQAAPNPCDPGYAGYRDCTERPLPLDCTPIITQDSLGTMYPLYTGEYSCRTSGTCDPGYTLAHEGTACVLVQNPCRTGGPGQTTCAGQARQCFASFVFDAFNKTLFLGEDKFFCGSCAAGYIERTIIVNGASQRACLPRPNPCAAGGEGDIACGTFDVCYPVVVTSSSPLYSGAYVCVNADRLHCPDGYHTEYSESGDVNCVAMQEAASSASARNIGLAVGLALLLVIIVIVAFIVIRKRRAAKAKVTYNFAQQQEFDIVTKKMKSSVANPLAPVSSEIAEWDNPLADNQRHMTNFDNPMISGSASNMADSEATYSNPADALSAGDGTVSGVPTGTGSISRANYRKPKSSTAFGAMLRSDVDMNSLTTQELMQLENPLYIPEEESDFTNPLAHAVKKKKANN